MPKKNGPAPTEKEISLFHGWLCSSENYAQVSDMLDIYGPRMIEAIEKAGYRPALQQAAIYSQTAYVGILQEKGGVDILMKDNYGDTAMHFAARSSNPELMIKYISGYGIDIDARNDRNETPLMTAAYHGTRKSLPYLIKAGADIHAKNDEGNTALHVASCSHYDGKFSVEALIKEYKDVDCRNDAGETPLMLAARWGIYTTIEPLIMAGADVNATNHKGETALIIAGQANNSQSCEVLIEHGIDIAHKDNDHKTVFDYGEDYFLQALEKARENILVKKNNQKIQKVCDGATKTIKRAVKFSFKS